MTEGDAPVVIFGAAGQDGHYLAEHHRRGGDRVLCFGRSARPGIESLNVADGAAVARLIREYRPRVIYQLAGVSTVQHQELWANHAAIATGTLNVLEAVFAHSRATKVVAIGSALQFQNRGQPISERDPFEASSVYALARIHAAHAARYYQSVGVRAYVGYLFHHDSPIRSPPHLSGRICRDVAAVARGQADHVDVGDPEMVKEWGFAGDAAAALATLAGQDQVFEAVIGTGEGQTVGAWVERCFAQAGLSASGRVRVVEGFPVGPRSIVSRPDTLRSLGWSPAVTFDGLAAMMMRRVLERIGSP